MGAFATVQIEVNVLVDTTGVGGIDFIACIGYIGWGSLFVYELAKKLEGFLPGFWNPVSDWGGLCR